MNQYPISDRIIRTYFLFFFTIVMLGSVVADMILLSPDVARNYDISDRLVSGEIQFFGIVVSSSVLGCSVRIIYTFLTYLPGKVFDRQLYSSYVTRLLMSIAVGLMIYFLIRGFILFPGADLKNLNKFGIAALIFFAGFTESVILKRIIDILRTAAGEPSPVEKQIDKISNVLGTQLLTNYNGFLHLTTRTIDNQILPMRYLLIAQFLPVGMTSAESNENLESISINGGSNERTVEFTIDINSRSFRIYPSERTLSFDVFSASERLEFHLDPQDAFEEKQLFVEVFQGNKMVAVINKRL